MKKFLLIFLCLMAAAVQANPVVLFDTTEGRFAVELFKDKVPVTVENFLTYVRAGHYDDTIFHRVVADAKMGIVQGGGYTQFDRAGVIEKPGLRAPIALEVRKDLSNAPYTLAMARQDAPHTATSQFFINGKDNSAQFDGAYAVFGKVLTGCTGCEKLVDRIVATPIKPIKVEKFGEAPFMAKNVPATPIRILSATVLQE
jgi:cyclophilin family peptidyl-prolyl cis-trans isomerase